jgi:SAM-dependent methyltransferase
VFRSNKIIYTTKKCSSLSDEEIDSCSKLFSNNYGVYSSKSPKNPGKSIKLGVKYYDRYRQKENSYVSLARLKNKIIGQAFYILEKTTEGYLSWIIQLVVDKRYRKKSIGKRLLLSVWGFSNDRAWGLATTNPLTIKTLESSTFRNVSFSAMQKNEKIIKQIGNKVPFIPEQTIEITKHNAVVNTNFYVNHRPIKSLIRAYGKKKWQYGELPEGYEWLAFVFQGQEIRNIGKKEFDKLLDYSESCLIEAYSRMQMDEHPWTHGTKRDVDYITKYITNKNSSILDIGCGTGRHLFELYERGYINLKGIDFSPKYIEVCKSKNKELEDNFEVKDFRNSNIFRKFDYAICLYDVVGTFAKEEDNIAIIRNIYISLKKGGLAFISVMNMELTENIAKNITDIYKNPKKLFKLKSSTIMQSTGDIFNPEYFIIDTHTNTIFRKEKFVNDGEISAEYIVRDRRYYRDDMIKILNKIGFEVIDCRCVRAGHFDEELDPTNLHAKEILFVVKKRGFAPRLPGVRRE